MPLLGVEEVSTDEKVDAKGDAVEVEVFLPRGGSLEARLVAKGASPRRVLVPGAGRPQAEGCPLTNRAPVLEI